MYCSQCGANMSDSANFCSQCGARRAEVLQTVSSVRYAPTPPASPGAQKRYRRPVVFRAAACILIAAMSISAAVKLMPGWKMSLPNADRGRLEETQTVSVGIDMPVVTAAGVTVDVNELNLTGGDMTLTVWRYEQKVGGDGFLGVEYDIALSDRHYLRAPLTVTLPYDANAARDSKACILHYDSDYEEWIPQDTERDEEAGTVSVKLTSLSPLRLVYFDKDYSGSLYYIADKDHSYATLKVSYDYWDYIKNTPMEPARIVAQDYIANGNTKSSTSWINTAADATSFVNTYYTLFGPLADTVCMSVNALSTVGGAYKSASENVSGAVGVLSLAIAATQLMFDLKTKDSTGPQNETAINLYKNFATNSGTLYSFCTGYSSAAFSMGFLAVAFTGYMLDRLVAEAKTLQANTVEAVFDTYYKEHATFNEDNWYDIFTNAYWEAWQNNRDSEDGMNYAIEKVADAINAHAEKFWKDVYRDGKDTLTFAVAEAGKMNYYTPTEDQKAELTTRLKEDMFARFNSKVIPDINEFMYRRMQNEVFGLLWRGAEPYNRYHHVQIQEIAPEDVDGVCKYHSCPIRFGSADGFVQTDYPDEWELLAPQEDKEWAVKLKATLLGYIIAGAPDKVFLFDAWDEEKRFGEQIATETLNLAGKEAGYLTLIDLSSAGGTGAFTSFVFYESWKIDPTLKSIPVLIVAALIDDSLRSSDRIEMTHLGGNQYSFTIPAHKSKYKWNGVICERSISSVTFTGTMNADMTSGTFEASASPSVTSIVVYEGFGDNKSIAETIKDVRITAMIKPHINQPDYRLLAFECTYTMLNSEGKWENLKDPGTNRQIITYRD